MRILYIAKHGSGGNDDEGAIAYALQQLGHTVITMREQEASRVPPVTSNAEFAICHGWCDVFAFSKLPMPKAFWFFDRIDDPDPSLHNRNRSRINWVRQMTDAADIGFCTDGDWVKDDRTERLHWLTQGADERVAKIGYAAVPGPPILITASVLGGGERRRKFMSDFKERWRDKVKVVANGYHGPQMADLIAASKVVIAPLHPSSHRYWSNRVYQACGFGAVILHPHCEQLISHYPHLLTYNDETDLDVAIHEVLDSTDAQRKEISVSNYLRTMNHHTYRHRCQQLLATAKEKGVL